MDSLTLTLLSPFVLSEAKSKDAIMPPCPDGPEVP